MLLKHHRLRWSLMLCLAFSAFTLCAQRVAVKTNALYWAALAPNAGVEFRLSRHFTLNLEAAFSPFSISDYQLHTTTFTPEVRYWLSGRPQAGHFVGAMASGSAYNARFSSRHHEGNALGAGLTYGYSFTLARRWTLETTIGAGLLHYREKKYAEGEAIPTAINKKRTIPAPLKAGITLTYILK